MAANQTTTIQVTCPCCDAMLTIDPTLAVVLDHKLPVKPHMALNLKDAVNQSKEKPAGATKNSNNSPKRKRTNPKSSKPSSKSYSRKPKKNRSKNRSKTSTWINLRAHTRAGCHRFRRASGATLRANHAIHDS